MKSIKGNRDRRVAVDVAVSYMVVKDSMAFGQRPEEWPGRSRSRSSAPTYHVAGTPRQRVCSRASQAKTGRDWPGGGVRETGNAGTLDFTLRWEALDAVFLRNSYLLWYNRHNIKLNILTIFRCIILWP